MKKFLVFLLLSIILFYGVHFMFERNDPSKGEPRRIEVGMGMTVKEFIERNHLEMGPWKPQQYIVDVDDIGDWMPIQFTDNWIALRLVEESRALSCRPEEHCMCLSEPV